MPTRERDGERNYVKIEILNERNRRKKTLKTKELHENVHSFLSFMGIKGGGQVGEKTKPSGSDIPAQHQISVKNSGDLVDDLPLLGNVLFGRDPGR